MILRICICSQPVYIVFVDSVVVVNYSLIHKNDLSFIYHWWSFIVGVPWSSS